MEDESLLALQRQARELADRQQVLARDIRAFQAKLAEMGQPTASPELQAPERQAPVQQRPVQMERQAPRAQPVRKPVEVPGAALLKGGWEKFIGENLLSTLGIIILVIGVAIGVRYAIDKGLISPLMRILLGYLAGGVLAGLALWLKAKYRDFSAVLMSGALATVYFITYFAFAFYQFLSRPVAFGGMFLTIAATIFIALHYNRQIIAIIGLVGAYSIPVFLSDGSGRMGLMFTYMTFTNLGILVLAEYRDWKTLFRLTFAFTWGIFLGWYVSSYMTGVHFMMVGTFLPLFYLTFYAMFLLNRLRQAEPLKGLDIILLLVNTAVFYGIGYFVVHDHPQGKNLLGLFTLATGLLQFGVVFLLNQRKYPHPDLSLWIGTQGLVLLTIAIPVQFDGNWVTLLWAAEAVLLLVLSREKNLPDYEKWAWAAMGIACYSLVHDWESAGDAVMPFFNATFGTGLWVLAALIGLLIINQLPRYAEQQKAKDKTEMQAIMQLAVIVGGYAVFFREIQHWFDLREKPVYLDEWHSSTYAWEVAQALWISLYSLGYVALIQFLNNKLLKTNVFATPLLVISLVATGLVLLYPVPMSSWVILHFWRGLSDSITTVGEVLWLHYGALLTAAGLLFLLLRSAAEPLRKPFGPPVVAVAALIAGSNEVLLWFDAWQFQSPDKLTLSIFWGVFALVVMAVGIFLRNRWLRYGAIGLFGGTLLKLFFYDLTHLDTLSRTILFVSLGVLLLIISFLYQKFTARIFEEE